MVASREGESRRAGDKWKVSKNSSSARRWSAKRTAGGREGGREGERERVRERDTERRGREIETDRERLGKAEPTCFCIVMRRCEWWSITPACVASVCTNFSSALVKTPFFLLIACASPRS